MRHEAYERLRALRGSEPNARETRRRRERASSGELLIGDRGGRKQLRAGYEQMHQALIVPHADIVAFVRQRRLQGRGVGWIDAHLLASALVGRLRLWTTDPRLATLAKELGIAYD